MSAAPPLLEHSVQWYRGKDESRRFRSVATNGARRFNSGASEAVRDRGPRIHPCGYPLVQPFLPNAGTVTPVAEAASPSSHASTRWLGPGASVLEQIDPASDPHKSYRQLARKEKVRLYRAALGRCSPPGHLKPSCNRQPGPPRVQGGHDSGTHAVLQHLPQTMLLPGLVSSKTRHGRFKVRRLCFSPCPPARSGHRDEKKRRARIT